MLTKRIIASLLLRNGRLVKGRAFQNHRDAGHPVTTIRALCAQGIDEILLLNIGETHDWQTLEAVAEECTVPLTFGGGIRCRQDARDAFCRGADKVFVGGRHHDVIQRLSLDFGTQAVVAGLDLPLPPDHPGNSAGEVRVIERPREGCRRGFGNESLAGMGGRPIILEGGAGTLQHIADAFHAGADAVALGTMLVFGDNNILKIKRYLKAQGFPVRL